MKTNIYRKYFTLALLGLSILGGNANANLSSVDYATNSGDNWLTRDSVTHLDWLDVSLTTFQTFDQVRTGIWYQRGFRYASKDEVKALFLHAGTPDDGFNVAVTHPAETLVLAQLLGPTLVGGSRVTTMGFIGTDYFGNQITLANHPLGVTFSAQLGKVDYLGTYGEAHFTGGQPFSDQADSSYGSFLVRTVPIPAAAWLLSSGLLGLIGVARRNALKV